MPLNIHGLNAGVIRHNNNFAALALKIKHEGKKESLLFFPLLPLKDLFLCLEQHLNAKTLLSDDARQKFNKAADSAAKKLQKQVPEIIEDELRHADVNLRVEHVTLTENNESNLTLALTLHSGNTLAININDAQMPLLVKLIIHSMNNAGLRAIVESLSSLLDFLPIYDVDCQDKGQMEYDSYQHPEWKHALFNHYLAMIYLYKNEQGEEQTCGTIVKTRTPSSTKEAESIAKRLLRYSNRLRKLENKPCKVMVKTLVADKSVTLTQEQCMYALHTLRMQSEKVPA